LRVREKSFIDASFGENILSVFGDAVNANRASARVEEEGFFPGEMIFLIRGSFKGEIGADIVCGKE